MSGFEGNFPAERVARGGVEGLSDMALSEEIAGCKKVSMSFMCECVIGLWHIRDLVEAEADPRSRLMRWRQDRS